MDNGKLSVANTNQGPSVKRIPTKRSRSAFLSAWVGFSLVLGLGGEWLFDCSADVKHGIVSCQ